MEPKKTTALTVVTETDIGVGYEDVSASEILIPRIEVLQGQERKDDPRAEDEPRGQTGDLFNTVTREVTPGREGIVFVPVARRHEFVAWTPRNDDGSGGGGPWATYRPEDEVVLKAQAAAEKRNKLTTTGPTGETWELDETFTMPGLILDEDGDVSGFAVLGIRGSKIKKYKALVSMLVNFVVKTEEGKVKPPIFANRLRVRGARQENANGHPTYVFDFSPLNGSLAASYIPSDSPLREQARMLRDMIATGQARFVEEAVEAEVEAEATEKKDGLPF